MRDGSVLNSPLAAPALHGGGQAGSVSARRRKPGEGRVDPLPEPGPAALAAPSRPGQEGGAPGRPEDLHGEPEAYPVGLAACTRVHGADPGAGGVLAAAEAVRLGQGDALRQFTDGPEAAASAEGHGVEHGARRRAESTEEWTGQLAAATWSSVAAL